VNSGNETNSTLEIQLEVTAAAAQGNVRAAASFTGTITVSVACNPNGNCSPRQSALPGADAAHDDLGDALLGEQLLEIGGGPGQMRSPIPAHQAATEGPSTRPEDGSEYAPPAA
jgi:hypothetical protein